MREHSIPPARGRRPLRRVLVTVLGALTLALAGGVSAAAAATIVGGAQDPASASAFWMTGSDGGVYSFGGAGAYGSLLGTSLNAPIVGMAATPDGEGYWLVGGDGGIFNFGDAGFYGSAGNVHLSKPVVGIAATPDGKGYWLVGGDGGVFNYGDAGFYGSLGGKTLNAPIVGIAGTPDGKGYWLVGGDGGVFNFGDAGFYGSEAGQVGTSIVGLLSTPDGKGYRLVGSNEAAHAFGDAGPAPAGGSRSGGSGSGSGGSGSGSGGSSPPPSAGPPVVTVPRTTTLPRPRNRRALKIRMAIRWTWNHSATRLTSVTARSMPERTQLTLHCAGRGCPRGRTLHASGRRALHRLLRRLAGRRYRAGDHLTLMLSAPGYRPERATVVIRNGRIPRVRLLGR
ncbi:MAG TPA: hypothetical protein VFN55_14025 [Solirubrobacteraceae bacterium]|nr:hypothetical protein [Solirubrobacteraceae bacterium]